MQYRRIVCLILGIWIGGGLMMAWYGSKSFQGPERIMNQSHPGFAVQTKALGPATTRTILRHLLADENRWMFQSWENLQLALGVFFFCYLLFGTMEGKFTLTLALIMLILTAVQRIGLSPQLGGLGISLDYLPADTVAAERAKFWMLHSLYVGMEIAKLGLALILCAIVVRAKRSVDPLNQFNMIDKANHRHVNW
jgi:hypothetical protein